MKGRFGADSQMQAPTATPQPADTIQNERGDRSRPARSRRRRMETFSRAFSRCSSSCSVSDTCRRRFCTASACALMAIRLALFSVTPWMRLSVRRSPER